MFGFLASLVERGIFSSIEVSFLPTGHTHNSLDRWFGKIALKVTQKYPNMLDQINEETVRTIPALINCIKRSREKTPVFFFSISLSCN